MVSICPVCRAIFLESALLTQHYKVHSEELDKFDELTATPDPPDPVPSTSSQNSTYLIYDDEVTVEAERPQKKEKRKILVRYEIREIKEKPYRRSVSTSALPTTSKLLPTKPLNRISRGASVQSNKIGANKKQPIEFVTELDVQDELDLVKWIINCARRGYPQNVKSFYHAANIKLYVKSMIQKPKINNPRLANNYYNSFKQRHPDITSSIFNATDCSSRNQLRMLHSNLTDHLTDSNLLEIFDDPKRIANCDIMQLPVDPMKKYYCEAIFTCCANGSFLRPLVFVSGNKSDMKFKQYDQFDELEKVSEETLEYYIKYSFVTSMNYYRVTFPVVLMLDLQRFEISSQIMSLCVKHKIILMSPYSHFKQIIQPFEVAVVFSIKLNWKKFLVNSFGKDFGESLTSINFAKTLKLFCDHHLSPDRIKYAFKICGIYPWSQFGIDHKDLMRFCRTRPVESNTRNCNLLIAAKDEETMQSVYRNDQLTRT